MKIGLFDPYLDDLGGGEKYMMSIAFCLSKKHQVTIFWDNQKDIKELQERFLLDFSSISVKNNIFSPKISLFERIKETKKYDAIVILSDGSIPFILSKKLFMHIQQPLEHVSLNLKTRFKLKRVSKIFCNSYFTKSFIDKSFKLNTDVIYPPVNLYPEKVKKENIILNVGRLRVRDVTIKGLPVGDYKKQTVLIKAFKDMIKRGLKEWRFILAISIKNQDKEILASVQKMVEGFPIELLVNKNNRVLWEVYNKASIYWHGTGYGEDLEKYPEYAEHFGISTVESMGAGAVPVVIAAGGQKEIVREGENGFLWNSLEELQNKTFKLVENEKLWKKMSEAAKKRAREFTGERFCREISNLIEE